MVKIERLKEKVAALEAKLAHRRAVELAALPRRFGFDSATAFLDAVKAAAQGRRRKAVKRGRRKRALITPEIKARVISAVKAGKKTAALIAKEVGISVPSVANIKKAAGLVRSR